MDGLPMPTEQLLVWIVETIPDMIFVKDADELRFVLLNKAAEDLLGMPRAQVLGRSDHDLFPTDQADAFVARDREVLTGIAAPEIVREEILSPTRGRRLLETRRLPIFDEGGTPRYLLGIAEDVTERDASHDRDEVERQLQQARKMEAVGHLAAGVAHDFNNILTAIKSFSELLLQDLPSASPHRADVQEIAASADRAAALTRQLLAFSRRQRLQPVPVDLNQVVIGVTKMLARLIGVEIRCSLSLASDLGVVRADPGQLEQLLINLAVNARDAMPNGGHLIIETANVVLDGRHALQLGGTELAVPGPYVMLAVNDTGSGMDRDTAARIFEPFFTTKEAGKGTGLGLSTVFSIVKQSGGQISVYSEVGRGTTFRVYLPRIDAEVQPAAAVSAP